MGLHGKAGKIENVSHGKLATLEAIIKKMPNRYKSDLPEPKPLYEKNDSARQMIETILLKYPHHKRVLFIKAKYDNNELLSDLEMAELKKFEKMAI